ncbi:unnamed protein product [Mytilus edulis]|uniref:Endonuclease/exonuclease/phosphatase domain-containing protein n=1 Tax=Mytilus edulis TaxID=6550 RepID=A0A8S3TXB6_MYTED|nr:unnamed protein product [Mytilus edulis]
MNRICGKISYYSSKSRGVAILFKNTFEFKIHEETIDLMGNFIILDITIQDYRITLAAIYGPNNDDTSFFENIKHKISHYGNSSTVVAGDWNVVQDYDMDTLHYRSENNLQSKAKIHGSDKREGYRKLNNSLLRETEFIDKVKGDIKTVIEEYESDPSMDIETEDK